MPLFTVEVSKDWVEHGTVVIEAADSDEAREVAQEMLTDGDESIEWQGMDPGAARVDNAVETYPSSQ